MQLCQQDYARAKELSFRWAGCLRGHATREDVEQEILLALLAQQKFREAEHVGALHKHVRKALGALQISVGGTGEIEGEGDEQKKLDIVDHYEPEQLDPDLDAALGEANDWIRLTGQRFGRELGLKGRWARARLSQERTRQLTEIITGAADHLNIGLDEVCQMADEIAGTIKGKHAKQNRSRFEGVVASLKAALEDTVSASVPEQMPPRPARPAGNWTQMGLF